MDLGTERAQLLRRLDVARAALLHVAIEEQHATESELPRELRQPIRQPEPPEAQHEVLTDPERRSVPIRQSPAPPGTSPTGIGMMFHVRMLRSSVR